MINNILLGKKNNCISFKQKMYFWRKRFTTVFIPLGRGQKR